MARSISFDVLAIDKASKALGDVAREVTQLDERIDRSGGSIEVDAETAKAREKLRAIDSQLARLNAKSLKVDADIAGAERDLKVLDAELKRATGDRKVKVEADIATAQARLRALRAEKVSIDVDTAGAQAKVAALDAQMRAVRDKDVTVDVNAAGALGTLAELGMQMRAMQTPVTIGIGVAGALEALQWIQRVGAGLTSIGTTAVVSGGIAVAALDGVMDAVTALGEEGPQAAKKLAEAMAKLTPEGQEFALFLRGLIDGPLKELRDTSQEKFLPGLQDGISEFMANLGTAKESIAGIAQSFGDFFRDIGPSAGRAAEAFLRLANLGAETTFEGLADSINGALDSFTAWANSKSAEEVAADIKEIGNTVATMYHVVMTAVRAIQFAWEALKINVNGELFRSPIEAGAKLYDGMQKLSEPLHALTGWFPQIGGAASTASGGVRGLESAHRDLAAGMQTAIDKNREMVAAFASGEQASIGYEAALDRAAESLRANGATLNIHTEQGRANRQSLLDMASAANRVVESMQEANAPVSQVTATFGTQRQALIAQATQFGMTKAQATAYVDQLLKTPEARTTKVTAETAAAQANIKQTQTDLAGVKDKTVNVKANNSSARDAINSVSQWLANLRDKTVTIFTRVIGGGTRMSSGGWVPGAASNVDSVDTKLAPGEFVVRSSAAAKWGPLLEQINSGASLGAKATPVGTLAAIPAQGSGGGGGPSIVVHVTVANAVVGNNDELARVVATAAREGIERGYLPRTVLATGA